MIKALDTTLATESDDLPSTTTHHVDGGLDDGGVGEHASVEVLADYLVEGFWEDSNLDRRAFDVTGSNNITVNLSGLTAEGQQLARWAFEAWEMVANLHFVEVEMNAQISFDDEVEGAFTGSNTRGTEITSALVNVSQNWLSQYGTELNSYSMLAYIHEIGHALGLGHQGNYNGGAVYSSDHLFANDSWLMSVMSYFSQQENTTVDASSGLPISPMMVDIVAIQSIYGAPGDDGVTAGDTIWGHGSNLGNYFDTAFQAFLEGNEEALGSNWNFVFTIYDSDGTDTLDLSPLLSNNRIDMNDGSFSDIRGRDGAFAIAEGVELENLVLGRGNDTVTGNEHANEIHGGDGADLIYGENGHDWIWGGNGMDVIHGGMDRDIIFGNKNNDLLYGDEGDDLLVGQHGNDTLDGGLGDDVLSGGAGADSFCFQPGAGSDRIKDFAIQDGDNLHLSQDLVVDGVYDINSLLDLQGSVTSTGILFSFTTGDTLELTDVFSLDEAPGENLFWL